MLEGDGWTLGSMVGPNGEHHIIEGRPLTPEERERIPTAMARLREFSGHILVGPLVDALNSLNDLLHEVATVGQADFQRGPYRARLNGRLSAALTAFTNFRATIESNARALNLPFPMGSSVLANFQTLYREHPSFRLVHMLRNLDQHRPPASAVVTISVDADPETGESRTRPVIDVLAVCARCAGESKQDKHRKQWEECGALWAGQSEPVDVRLVFQGAYEACHVVLAAYISEAQPVILADVEFIARLVAEVEPWGAASALQVIRTEDARRISINQTHLDLLAFGDALATLDAARKVLGQPSLAEARLLPGNDECVSDAAK